MSEANTLEFMRILEQAQNDPPLFISIVVSLWAVLKTESEEKAEDIVTDMPYYFENYTANHFVDAKQLLIDRMYAVENGTSEYISEEKKNTFIELTRDSIDFINQHYLNNLQTA